MVYAIWDMEDDPDGNVQHIAEHGLTTDEVEEALKNAEATGFSKTSGRPVVWGYTSEGRYVKVVFEWIDDDTVYPVTAYEVPGPV